MKIGDINNDLKQYSEARREYQSGLATCEAALAKRSQSFNLQRDRGKALYRIAELLRAEKTAGTSDEAGSFYRQAAEVQEALIARNAQETLAAQKAPDLTLKSNLAATYTHWGMLEREVGDLNLALGKFQQGVALDEELIKAEPGNLQWVNFVAPGYLNSAEIQDQLNRPKEARDYYEKFFDAKRTLAFRGLGPLKTQREFAEAAKLLGDRSTGLAQIDAYRSAMRIWGRLLDDPKGVGLAAEQFDVILGLANFFDGKKDWPDAQTAYGVAQKIAMLNYAKDPTDASWRDKAQAAEKASVVAGQAAEAAPADTPH
jgi:tetratricopeptide (TPR) repeat protein